MTITKAQLQARRKNASKAARGRKQAVADRRADGAARVAAAGVEDRRVSEARLASTKAELAEIELAKQRGEYISVDQARRDVIAAYTIVKVRLLAVHSRLGQRWPGGVVDPKVIQLVEELIREALDELADERAPGQRNHETEQEPLP